MACKPPYLVTGSDVMPEGGKQRRFGKWNDGYDGHERVCLTRGEFLALARVVCAGRGDVAWSSSKHHAELLRVVLIYKSTDLRGIRKTYYATPTRLGRYIIKRAVEAFIKTHPRRVPDA